MDTLYYCASIEAESKWSSSHDNLFCDDVSGNRGKKWNKFVEWNLTIAGTTFCFLTMYIAHNHITIIISNRPYTKREEQAKTHTLSMLL